MADLRRHTEETLARCVDLANRLGYPSISFMGIGTDPVEELENLCVDVYKRLPRSTIFAGQLLFGREGASWRAHEGHKTVPSSCLPTWQRASSYNPTTGA